MMFIFIKLITKIHIKTIVPHTQYTGCLKKCPFVRRTHSVLETKAIIH